MSGRLPAHGVRRAGPSDLDPLLPLVVEFCTVDGHDYDERRVTTALGPLLRDDAVGQVWVVETEAGALAGYGVVTWGWSLESGGRDALLDELYVRDRNHGLGTMLLEEMVAAAGATGATRMFLETEDVNVDGRRFYARHGFEAERSVWMQRSL